VLEACTGVFLTGGDQLRLCAVLADTPAMEPATGKKKSNSGRTSAGAAIMGHHMIAGGGSGDLESGAGRVGDGARYSAR